jgi:hypothetical protein
MTSSGGERHHVGSGGPGPRLVPVSVVADADADPDYIDDAFDDLLLTVDDLARDLDVEPQPQPAPTVVARPPKPPRVWSREFAVGVIVVSVVLGFLVLVYLLSNL